MEDKPIFSTRLSAGTRVYYVDVRTDKRGTKYMTLSEIATDKKPGQKKRERIFIHKENIQKFIDMVNEASAFI